MPKAHPIQAAYNAGEFSPLMEGHINLEKRADAGLLVQNLLALKQGPLMRRGGTKFVKEVKDSSNRTALIPFEFSTIQAYQIEVGDQYFRFYRNNSIITATAQNITDITEADPAVVTYSGSDTYANGDEVYISGVSGMTEVNGKFFIVANVNAGANTFELNDIDGNNIDSTNYTAYTSGGTVAEVYTVASPYEQANLFDSDGLLQMQYAQSADVLFLTTGAYATRSLSRTGHASWTLTSLVLNDGPYLDVNDTATTLTLSGTSGSVTVTASATTGINGNTGFASTDVGRIIRWKDPANNWTWLTITAFTDTTHVTATISGPNASAGTATANWRLGVYSDTTGWPKVVAFFQDRILLANCDDYPDRWDLSITGGYSQGTLYFQPSNAAGTVSDSDAISGTLQSGSINPILWAAADEKGLLLGTAKKEWLVRSSETNSVLTPSNAKADPVSSLGSAYIKPIEAESGVIVAQRARRRVHDIVYSFELDRLKPRDLTLAAEHITQGGLQATAFQQEPVNNIWAIRGDGLLIGQTYYPDQGVFGWGRHPIGGVASIAQISQSAGDNVGDMTGNGGLDAAFDGDTSKTAAESAKASGLTGYVAKDWGKGKSRTVTQYKIWGSSDSGYDSASGSAAISVSLRGSNDGINWTVLHSTTVTDNDTANAQTFNTGISTTQAYRYHAVFLSAATSPILAQVEFYGSGTTNPHAIVESISVIPSSDGTRDELWLIVKRLISGTTRRYVEYMTRYYDSDMDKEDAFHVDCGLTYDGAATDTVTGLDHLLGETVKLMVDGKAHPDLTVSELSDGVVGVTLANSRTGSVIQIGLGNKWAFLSMQIEAGAADGTAQGKTKRITNVVVRLLNTLGLRYGAGPDKELDEYDFDQGSEYDKDTPLFTGDTPPLPWPSGSEQAGQIYLEHDGVFPACIRAIMPRVITQDR